MKNFLITTTLILIPFGALAAGGGGDNDNSPPAKTATTLECSNGQVAVKGTVGTDANGLKIVTVQKLLQKVSYPINNEDAAVGSKIEICVDPATQSFNTDEVYNYVRELAYAGRYDDALTLLAMAPDQEDPRILTYYGFTNRMLGKTSLATVYYLRAIELDPANVLARSYYGQSLAERGHKTAAKLQLASIAEHGGEDTWAYASLASVIDGAKPYRF